MTPSNPPRDVSGPRSPQFTIEATPSSDELPAWEEVDTGRYMPRRVRGSFQGRALG